MRELGFSERRRARRTALALLAGVLTAAGAMWLAAGAEGAANPSDSLIYMPYGLIHSIHSVEAADQYLAEIDHYDIGQFVFAMPKFKAGGFLKVPRHNREMLHRFSSQAASYDAEHDAALTMTIVYNGKIGTRGNDLNLEVPATRTHIVAAIEATLGDGASGVQLDLEPYPTTPGFLTLLEELDAAFTRLGFPGRLSVTAPATVSHWTASYLHRVSELVDQVDPLYYDSESETVAAYQSWIESGLAFYSENVLPTTRIVPVLPSYSADRWHLTSVENITTATEALAAGLLAGDRVNGAGIWSGWGFLLDEEGKYDGSQDRATWLSQTVGLPFSP